MWMHENDMQRSVLNRWNLGPTPRSGEHRITLYAFDALGQNATANFTFTVVQDLLPTVVFARALVSGLRSRSIRLAPLVSLPLGCNDTSWLDAPVQFVWSSPDFVIPASVRRDLSALVIPAFAIALGRDVTVVVKVHWNGREVTASEKVRMIPQDLIVQLSTGEDGRRFHSLTPSHHHHSLRGSFLRRIRGSSNRSPVGAYCVHCHRSRSNR